MSDRIPELIRKAEDGAAYTLGALCGLMFVASLCALVGAVLKAMS
jgi:hypothetical protein